MSQRKINILDKIGRLIPGYSGYAVRDEKRNTDKRTREFIALSIQQSENLIIQHQKVLINKGEIQQTKEWETVRKPLNSLYSKIKHASYGESSFFSENQLKEDELDNIYSIDLEMVERTQFISKTIQEEINEILSAAFVLKQINDIETLLLKRLNFINQHK
jgi:hypothetical protein